LEDDIGLVEAIIKQDVDLEEDVDWHAAFPKWYSILTDIVISVMVINVSTSPYHRSFKICHDRWNQLRRPILDYRSLSFPTLVKRVHEELLRQRAADHMTGSSVMVLD
jgi:hypothetical protein